MSCGKAWPAGTTAAVDGFCLQCPGELGPPVDANGAAARTQPTLPAEAPGSALDAVSDGSAPELPARVSSSTTHAIAGATPDDLEPRPPTRGSAALTKIHYAQEPMQPGATLRRQPQSLSPDDVEVNFDPLTGADTDQWPRDSSRRHPSAGSGDTTAVVLTGTDGLPLLPPTATSALARIAGVTRGLPAKLARLNWRCRDCRAALTAGSEAIAARRCAACGGKIEPELPPAPPGVPCLILYDPETRVRIGRFPLRGDLFLIGRLDPGSDSFPDLNLADYLAPADARQVSRLQCEVQRDRSSIPEALYLVPLPGNSGVYIKGTRVEPGERVLLVEQLLFGIGGDRIFLRFEANLAV